MTDDQDVAEVAVEGLTVRFGGVSAVADAGFAVRAGTIHALIGPNGAGKSSCFNAITGVYRAAAGSVRHRGERIDGRRPDAIAARGIARTFQNLVLPPTLSVYDCMRVARHHRTRAGVLATGLGLPRARGEHRRDAELIHDAAESTGIGPLLDRPVGSLSYGLRKKVEFARALCAEPTLLLLDEPVAGINDAESAAMAEVLLRARDERGLTVLLVEHDMPFVMGISDHVTVLRSGRVIADGSPERIRNDPLVIAAYLGDPPEDDPGADRGSAEPAAPAGGSARSEAGDPFDSTGSCDRAGSSPSPGRPGDPL
jgi:branched-chain amino acid transport system ATP-binding protein